MIARSYSQVRERFKYYCDKVTKDFETIIVTRMRGDNVVLISEEEYNNIIAQIKKKGCFNDATVTK